jgi:hypothetical protein
MQHQEENWATLAARPSQIVQSTYKDRRVWTDEDSAAAAAKRLQRPYLSFCTHKRGSIEKATRKLSKRNWCQRNAMQYIQLVQVIGSLLEEISPYVLHFTFRGRRSIHLVLMSSQRWLWERERKKD